jgi:hypothetical protein
MTNLAARLFFAAAAGALSICLSVCIGCVNAVCFVRKPDETKTPQT